MNNAKVWPENQLKMLYLVTDKRTANYLIVRAPLLFL